MLQLISLVVVELALYYVPALWRVRRYIAGILIISLTVWTLILALAASPGLVIVVTFINMFRIVNWLRLIKGRMHERHALQAIRRSGIVLMGVLALFIVSGEMLGVYAERISGSWVVIQPVVALMLLVATIRSLVRMSPRPVEHFYADKELPTVTVAIPARNETADLTSCLTSVLANDYPKLEIVVLDDCSQDRTSEIIKSFAQDGVRFIKGDEPAENWLAKNQAYDQLARAASGDYVMFMGVDVRLGPDAIKSLVSELLTRRKMMLSVLPIRVGGGFETAFIQPLRYWWELSLPRRIFNRPPVLSTCWIIERQKLLKLGGFKAVSRSIIPEGYFARELVKRDSYSFLKASEALNVRTTKPMNQQFTTAERMRYPQLSKRPENVAGLIVLEIAFLLAPFVNIALGLLTGFGPGHWLSLLAAGLLILNHIVVVSTTNPSNTLVSFINFPLAVCLELGVVLVSMYRYEFGTMDWRGRNICIPVMHVIPRLPSLEPPH